MLNSVFPFLIKIISKSVNWLFTVQINDSPKITLGQFLIGCAFIGIVIYFFGGTDFVPTLSDIANRKIARQASNKTNTTDKKE